MSFSASRLPLHDLVTPQTPHTAPHPLSFMAFHQMSHFLFAPLNDDPFNHSSGTDTQGPVSLLVGTGGFYAGLQPIRTIDNLSGSSTSVTIDQKEGTDMIFKITDSQNKVGYVQNIKVGGGDDSCLDSSNSGSGSSSSAVESSSVPASSSEAAPAVVETRKSISICFELS